MEVPYNAATFIFSLVRWSPLSLGKGLVAPVWATTLGWILTVSSVSLLPIWAVYALVTTPGTLPQVCRQTRNVLVVQKRCLEHTLHLQTKIPHPNGNCSFRHLRRDGEEACVGRGSRGCHGDQRRGEGGSSQPTEPSGYINGSACQLAVLDSLSAQSLQEVGRSIRARGSARAGFYLPPASGSLLSPARKTDGVVRTIDRIYNGGGKVGYLVYLDGRRFQLDMERDESVLSHHFSPQYVLAMMGQSLAPLQRECAYRGTVNSNPESLAVLNLCGGGLEGYFAVNHSRYTITPIIRAKGHEHNLRALHDRDAESALHVFTRESFSFEALSEGRESCGTRDGKRGRRNAAGRRRYRGRGRRNGEEGHGAKGRRWWSRLVKEPGARRKRSVSRARQVELLLVADDTMTKKYGRDLNHYLLTLASIASKLYGHASIENPIRLSVVKVITVSEKEKGLEVSKNAAATLKSFCKWQNQQNPLDDDHQHHHDAAILFTRQVNKLRPRLLRTSTCLFRTPFALWDG
ncbi:hypothetical protein XENOCAPTIV_006615 [Xenoophorus captivus]|uniref:Peptidase M12B domain-containing protein n=1 Tax=Xenoophorus captivus TaxID=1517983 RepID=A0ABV0RBV7_9TELE